MSLKDIEKSINRSIGQQLKGTEREVAKSYAKTLNEIRSMIGELYEKYSRDGILSYSDMVKYDRLNKFMSEIDSRVKFNYRTIYQAIYKALGWTYQETWDLSAWAIEADAKANLGYGTASAETLEAMINNPVKGLTLKATLEKYRADIIYTIQQQITQGLAKGETYRSMVDRIKPAVSGDAAKAMRIVRTEAHRVKESAKVEAAQHAHNQGVIMTKTWRSSQDDRVRRTSKANHRKLDGVTLPVNEDFKQGRGKGPGPGSMGEAAQDINCRCFLTYSVEMVGETPQDYDGASSFHEWKNKNK